MEPIDTTVGTIQPPIQPAPAPATREFNRLNGVQTQRFFNHVQEHYAALGLKDAEYLAKATVQLGFIVTLPNLWTALDQLVIENNDKVRERRLQTVVTRDELTQTLIGALRPIQDELASAHGKHLGIGDKLAHLAARIENLEEAAKKQSERMSAMEVSHG